MDDASLDTIRPYLLDYAEGILWMFAAVSLCSSPGAFAKHAQAFDTFLGQLPNLRMPDLVIGLIVLIIGIILPYCVSVTLRPVAMLLLNWQLSFQRRVTRRQVQEQAWLRGHEELQRHLGLGCRISADFCMMALEATQPTVARRLRNSYRDLAFRARAILPAALILASASAFILESLFRLTFPAVVSIGLALAFFALGSWAANADLEQFHEGLGATILLLLPKLAVAVPANGCSGHTVLGLGPNAPDGSPAPRPEATSSP